MKAGAIKEVRAHVFERQAEEHYVEPFWVSERLFEEIEFIGTILDPACGFGRIPTSAKKAGFTAFGEDLVDRGGDAVAIRDFFDRAEKIDNIVSNPPFGPRGKPLFKKFALHALSLATAKVALVWHARAMPAAKWLKNTPLSHVLYMTPRPSMPPGHWILDGHKVGGGKQDYVWLIFDHDHQGPATVGWLHRDRGAM